MEERKGQANRDREYTHSHIHTNIHTCTHILTHTYTKLLLIRCRSHRISPSCGYIVDNHYSRQFQPSSVIASSFSVHLQQITMCN